MGVVKELWKHSNLWDKFSVFCTTLITLGVVFGFNPIDTSKDVVDWLLVSIAFTLLTLNTFNDILVKVKNKLK